MEVGGFESGKLGVRAAYLISDEESEKSRFSAGRQKSGSRCFSAGQSEERAVSRVFERLAWTALESPAAHLGVVNPAAFKRFY